jgi:GntR family transcriptional regulator / MocR family aminotransferase
MAVPFTSVNVAALWSVKQVHLRYSHWTTSDSFRDYLMTKNTSGLPFVLPRRQTGVSMARWLYEALRAEILEGRLRPGARLPATRELASQYRVARGTVVAAFEQLASEGYVEGSVGSGTFVNRVLPDELLDVGRASPARGDLTARTKRRVTRIAETPFDGFSPRRPRAFRTDLAAVDLFPTTLWAQLTARRQRRASASFLLGCEPLGYPPLRNAIAGYLTSSRGVRCTADQIAIVSGVQEALDLVARLVLHRGDRVCVEDPGYPGASSIFEAAGARVVSVPVDEDGLELRARLLRGARLVYLTPAHQFPTGATMGLPRRLELLDWARDANALLFEDDYDSEFRYSGRPIPALQGLDTHGLVLFAGTFSKVLFPALRIGYLVLPPDLVAPFDGAISLTRRHAPLLEQAVLCDFIVDGHFGRHLRRMRQIYGERLAVLLDRARHELAGALELSNIEAGLQTTGWLAPGIDGESVAAAAAERDVDVVPLARYARRKLKRDGLQLGFAAVDAQEIRRGVRELAIALAIALDKRK